MNAIHDLTMRTVRGTSNTLNRNSKIIRRRTHKEFASATNEARRNSTFRAETKGRRRMKKDDVCIHVSKWPVYACKHTCMLAFIKMTRCKKRRVRARDKRWAKRDRLGRDGGKRESKQEKRSRTVLS